MKAGFRMRYSLTVEVDTDRLPARLLSKLQKEPVAASDVQ